MSGRNQKLPDMMSDGDISVISWPGGPALIFDDESPAKSVILRTIVRTISEQILRTFANTLFLHKN